jgi:ribosomal protein L40E
LEETIILKPSRRPIINGDKLENTCKRCGNVLQPEAEFCSKCGEKVGGSKVMISREVYGAMELKEARDWTILGIGLIVIGIVLLIVSIIAAVIQNNAAFVPYGSGMLIAGILAYFYGKKKASKYKMI